MTRYLWSLGFLLFVTCAGVVSAQTLDDLRNDGQNTDNVLTYGMGYHLNRYSALDQINKSNVSQLQVVWTFPVTGTVIFNPLVVDSVMYLQASGNTLVAVDASTGKEIWRRQMSALSRE